MWSIVSPNLKPITWDQGCVTTPVQADTLSGAIAAYDSISDGTPMMISDLHGRNYRMNYRSDIESLARCVSGNEDALDTLRTYWKRADRNS